MKPLTLATILLAALPACRPTPAAAPVSPAIFSALVVPPRDFAEIDLTMAANSTATAIFTASSPAAWNVHSHAIDHLTVHAEGTSAADRVRFTAPYDGVFSFLWQNTGTTPLTLDVQLRTEGRVDIRSTHPKR